MILDFIEEDNKVIIEATFINLEIELNYYINLGLLNNLEFENVEQYILKNTPYLKIYFTYKNKNNEK